ncbi:hypothetical protein J7F02_28320 [Streptomyces sp. ISL-112]|uniref:hypothetical protein n=1 Tax=unclassified Streptomyces TaxID=2593676 RepID=UPI001BE50C68|nr:MULTISPECIES: hypothetical protein [unclassified Streptomyces]MBT2429416.1 hypothetical protein [Streptomyces sp. ISL-112]MBT2464008.1 hypothetical protein [Streptomyces sp. ISL-63]
MTALAAVLAALVAGYVVGRWEPWRRLTRWADYRMRDDGRWWLAKNPLHAALFVITHPRGSLNAYRTRPPEETTR